MVCKLGYNFFYHSLIAIILMNVSSIQVNVSVGYFKFFLVKTTL